MMMLPAAMWPLYDPFVPLQISFASAFLLFRPFGALKSWNVYKKDRGRVFLAPGVFLEVKD